MALEDSLLANIQQTAARSGQQVQRTRTNQGSHGATPAQTAGRSHGVSDTSQIHGQSVVVLNSDPAAHHSDTNASKSLVKSQGHAASHITGGVPHGAANDAATDDHGAGHHFDPVHVGAHSGHYGAESLEGIDMALEEHGLKMFQGKDGAPAASAGAEKVAAIAEDISPSVSPTLEPAPKPDGPVFTRKTARPGSDMAEMVENIDKANDAVKAEVATASSTAKATETSAAATTEARVADSTHSGHSKLGKAVHAADKVLGPAAVYFGVKEVQHGLHQLHDADTATKKIEGTSNVVAGGATVMSGAATTTAALGVSAVAGVAMIPVAMATAGVAAAADGVKTFANGLSEHDGEKMAVGGVKSAAGVVMMAGVATGNPLLVAGGALTYGGAVVYENREAIGDWAGEKTHQVSEAAGNVKDATGEAITGAVDSISNAATGAMKLAFD